MRVKINKQVLNQVNFLVKKARKTKNTELGRKYIILARNLAKRNNLRLPKNLRKLFCHKCNTIFSGKTSQRRIKNKKISIKCLVCGKYTRYKLDVKGGKKK